MADVPSLKSAQGHVAHYERLIARYTHHAASSALPAPRERAVAQGGEGGGLG